jgi:Lrp/AsnC family leucine-responsive transcriptional regulator
MIDEIDAKVLTILQQNARTSNAEIARRVGMAPSAIFERIRKLEERGVIRGYSAAIDPRAVGLSLAAFMFVRTEEPVGQSGTAERLAALPEVQEVHHIAGEDCYLVKLRARDTDDLGRLLRDEIGTIPTVKSTRTTIVLGSIKEGISLALDAEAEGQEPAALQAVGGERP